MVEQTVVSRREAERSARARRREAELLAAARVRRGEAGADLLAHLLDAVDEARHGSTVPGGCWHALWLRSAGFADGPEVAS